VTLTCSRCGSTAEAPDGGLAPGWSIAVEDGRTVYECRQCVRDNIRAIEAKLPQEWWE
jgi:hypothetical protein